VAFGCFEGEVAAIQKASREFNAHTIVCIKETKLFSYTKKSRKRLEILQITTQHVFEYRHFLRILTLFSFVGGFALQFHKQLHANCDDGGFICFQ